MAPFRRPRRSAPGSPDVPPRPTASAEIPCAASGAGSASGTRTRARLLDAAERLFAEQNYEATSLRQVTRAADANLAAVSYHFGSKEGLFRAVFARRIGPINRERIERLQALERESEVVPLEALLRALMEPALRLASEPAGRWFTRLVGRAFSEPGEHWIEADREFDGTRAAFLRAFAHALPHLAPAELGWRLYFAIGAQCVLLSGGDQARRLMSGMVSASDPRAALDQLVAFTAAGLRAPAVGRRG